MSDTLAMAGWVVAIIGFIWIILRAFKTSLVWGLCSLLIPFVGLVYVFMHWEEAKKPFLVWLIGVGMMGVGAWMAPPVPA